MIPLRTFPVALLCILAYCEMSPADTIGTFREFDAAAGSPAEPETVYVGDLIRISVAASASSSIPETKIVQGASLTAVGAVVKDKTSYAAYYAAERVGPATVAFQYVSATGETVVTTFSFRVELVRPGRLIELGRDNSLTDVATGKPPVDGVRVGDVIRVRIGDKNTVERIGVEVVAGNALKKSVVATEGNDVNAYFSAARPGRSTIVMQFKIVGQPMDGGFISTPIEVSP